jgi:hypothetical protein
MAARWWRRQLIQAARAIDFYANLADGSWWVQLRLDALGERLRYLAAVHKVGTRLDMARRACSPSPSALTHPPRVRRSANGDRARARAATRPHRLSNPRLHRRRARTLAGNRGLPAADAARCGRVLHRTARMTTASVRSPRSRATVAVPVTIPDASTIGSEAHAKVTVLPSLRTRTTRCSNRSPRPIRLVSRVTSASLPGRRNPRRYGPPSPRRCTRRSGKWRHCIQCL